MQTQLTGAHRNTYEAVFQHPIARNLKWDEVKAMLVAMADTVQDHSDFLKVTRHGQSLVLHRPSRSGMQDISELMKVRHFLEKTGETVPAPVAEDLRLLVVIDHRMARIYRTELQGTVPQHITPYDPTGAGRHLHNVEDESNGQRKPERKSFYEAIAKAVVDAKQILVFGSGTGASSAMEQLLSELKSHHSNIAERIVGFVVVNEQHLTENQLLAKAREFYATLSPAPATKE
jgi:hypothetical protein